MKMNSAWTGRAPRSLQSAFGPYTDPHVYETRRTPRWHAWAYAVACVAALMFIGWALATGWR